MNTPYILIFENGAFQPFADRQSAVNRHVELFAIRGIHTEIRKVNP